MADHSGHRGRLKQEFLLRPDSFPDHKLLELLLFYANPRIWEKYAIWLLSV